jgi:hypothetical protein
MNPAVNELVRSVVEKNSLEECSVDELQHLVSQFPYFGPAQFLLAQKLKQQHSPLYTQQSQKAILYFQDHLWFDYLSGDESTGIISTAKHEVQVQSVTMPVKVEAPQPQTETNETPAATAETAEEPMITDHESSIKPAENEIEIDIPGESVMSTEENSIASDDRPGTETMTIEEVESPAPELSTQPDNEEALITPIVAETIHSETIRDEQPAKQEEVKLPGLAGLKIEQTSLKSQELTFEPYHTVDYFASQGIRYKEEEKPKDRFGQQLKSFTEWLKTLKKAPETPAANGKQPAPEDAKVNLMAEHSITDREVVTEAMADVWEKQGNYPKAIEIYGKLSLLNPSKSAYFAAKIEHLKHL